MVSKTLADVVAKSLRRGRRNGRMPSVLSANDTGEALM